MDISGISQGYPRDFAGISQGFHRDFTGISHRDFIERKGRRSGGISHEYHRKKRAKELGDITRISQGYHKNFTGIS